RMNLTQMDDHTCAARRVRFASGRSEERARVRTDAKRESVSRARECPSEAKRESELRVVFFLSVKRHTRATLSYLSSCSRARSREKNSRRRQKTLTLRILACFHAPSSRRKSCGGADGDTFAPTGQGSRSGAPSIGVVASP